MCGRFLNHIPAAETARIFATTNALLNYPARYNIAPTQGVLAVRFNPHTHERSLDELRWGLVPHWASDLSFGNRCINARAETVDRTPAFRDAFKNRRCIVPASGFYEWKKLERGKQPFAIVPADERLFAFADLWESWRDKAAGESAEWIRTCTIVTGKPNELVKPIHDRMPVILDRSNWAKWLGEEPSEPDELHSMLLTPFPSERMRVYPVSTRVNTPRNDDEALVEEVV